MQEAFYLQTYPLFAIMMHRDGMSIPSIVLIGMTPKPFAALNKAVWPLRLNGKKPRGPARMPLIPGVILRQIAQWQ